MEQADPYLQSESLTPPPMDSPASISRTASSVSRKQSSVSRSRSDSVDSDSMSGSGTGSGIESGLSISSSNLTSVLTDLIGDPNVRPMHKMIKDMLDWFRRASDYTQRQFSVKLMTLLREDRDLLGTIRHALRVLGDETIAKDFAYSRARANPGLDDDAARINGDRALAVDELIEGQARVFKWLLDAPPPERRAFVFAFLKTCPTHLLATIANLVADLIASSTEPEPSGVHSFVPSTFSICCFIHIQYFCLPVDFRVSIVCTQFTCSTIYI